MTAAPQTASSPTVLCLDTASPTVSVALAAAGEVVAEEREPIARSSVRLLPMIDSVLAAAGLRLDDLRAGGGIAVLAGPGSFTGLRVGMATAIGLHQAGGVAATAVSTFAALAAWRSARAAAGAGGTGPLVAAVDVLRGEWAIQAYRPASRPSGEECAETFPAGLCARGEPRRLPAAELATEARQAAATIVGFGTAGLAESGLIPAASYAEPGALAAPAAAELSLLSPRWDPATLTRPVYFRPPAVTLPAPRPSRPG